MVLGWRRALCTSNSKDQKQDSTIIRDASDPVPSPRLRSRFGGFFSNSSTPRLETQPVSGLSLRCRTTVMPPEGVHAVAVPTNSSAPQSVKLHCKTGDSPSFFNRSTPSSPRSPSTFSLLKSSLGLAKSRCRICLQGVKTGGGTAIFSAECGHSFHFLCISSFLKKQGSLACPVCNSAWKEMHLLNSKSFQNFYKDDHERRESEAKEFSNQKNSERRCTLKVYNDDEPLSSRTSCARFNPIPESDETEEEDEEFPRFYGSKNMKIWNEMGRSVEIAFSPEVAVISVGKTNEFYAVRLKIKAPATPVRSAPIDLVTVLNVSRSVAGEKLRLMKRAMRLVVSSLSAADRLSIVAFSATSKRLLPLRRMTTAGKKSARMIIDAVGALECASSSPMDSLKKAAKLMEDRLERNPSASILLFTDGHRNDPVASSSRVSLMKIPIHSFNLSACVLAPPDSFAKYINSTLSTTIQDLEVQLVPTPGSPPYDIPAVYSYTGSPAFIGSGSSWFRVGDFHSEEEKELLVELKVPSSAPRTHRFLSVRCSYKDLSTLQRIHDRETFLPLPRPSVSGSSTREIKRLKCLFIATRAVTESRRLVERNDIGGAQHMLASARALVAHSGEEFVRLLESELSELNRTQLQRRKNSHEREAGVEPITPTSAWRTAERLAKVAIMKKSLNRVSDLHGFEDARF
ncbi:probable E3 ubiquitin-protein ligase EDA40 isoform X2 [Primulina huaijiensis]|uniref:probable E3 ubiquitin-protein ligase EDA40 isoform X2 n=1 Tax=Primulina huaijiensis TaxID=1492673 RepID=UPI003CC6EBEB